MLQLTGCAPLHPIGPVAEGFNLSSASSDYSPTARLAIRLPVLAADADADKITVVVDSAIIVAPGVATAASLPIMRQLYGTLLLAAASRDQPGESEPAWRAIVESDSILLADSLRLGEPHAVGRFRLILPRPPALDATRTWLVFRISGSSMTTEVRSVDGRIVRPRKAVAGGVRVYACADWSLSGDRDPDRARAMAQAYTTAC
jgi:hypothetical protein